MRDHGFTRKRPGARSTRQPVRRQRMAGPLRHCGRMLATIALCLTATLALAQGEGGAAGEEDAAVSPLEHGRQLYFEGNYEAARQAWMPLAEAGDPRALYNMATLYRRGLGVARDRARARDLLERAAEKGFALAQYVLADLVMRDEAADDAARQQAVRWWLAAARQGHALSQYRLGLLYWNGEAVARDLVRAHAWMRLASEQGLEDASEARATMEEFLDDEQLSRSAALAEDLRPGREAGSETAAAPELPAEELPEPVGAAASAGEAATAEPVPSAPSPDTPAARAPSPEAGWQLQLAALRDRATAERLWRRLSRDAPDLVAGLGHDISDADLGERGIFYRLRIGPFASREAAERRCAALKAAGFGCFAIAPDS